MLQDVRYALRMLLKSKVLTVIAILSLALGIGANTALFSVIDGMVLRVLPIDKPGELTLLNWSMGQYGWAMNTSGSIRRDANPNFSPIGRPADGFSFRRAIFSLESPSSTQTEEWGSFGSRSLLK